MTGRLFDPQYWRERAEEARCQAAQMTEPRAKRALLGIAENYEQIAQQQEEMLLRSERS